MVNKDNYVIVSKPKLISIGNSVRNKIHTEQSITLDQMATEINNMKEFVPPFKAEMRDQMNTSMSVSNSAIVSQKEFGVTNLNIIGAIAQLEEVS